jgi:hypothetical protein
MKRVLVLAVVALVATAIYVATAPAGQQAVTPKQFNALSKRVKALEKDNKDIKEVLGIIIVCVMDKGAVATTKAPQYHATGAGEATDFYVLTTNNADCVNIINSPQARSALKNLGR